MNTPDTKIRNILDLIQTNWPEASASQAGMAIAAQRLGRLIERVARDALRPVGLTYTEFEVLCVLRTQPPPHRLIPSDLYDAVLISSGGLTKVLKGLEARGLVLRPEGAADGRSRPVALSADGKLLVERAMQAVQRAEAAIMDAMGGVWRGTDSLSEGLVALAAAAESARTEPAATEQAVADV